MLQVYTGGGKGKTTAAIGLAIRMLGTGRRVFMMQFMKGLAYSEQKILRGFGEQLVLKTSGKPFFIAKEGMLSDEEIALWGEDVVVFAPGNPPPDYVALIADGLKEAQAAALSGEFSLVILDELNAALLFELVGRKAVEDFLAAVAAKGQDAPEIVITGRGAPDWLIERADLVSEMREIKHYYTKGVEARRGIED